MQLHLKLPVTRALLSVFKELKYSVEFSRSNANQLCCLVSQNCKLINLLADKDKEIKDLRLKVFSLENKDILDSSLIEELKAVVGVLAVFSSVNVNEKFNVADRISVVVNEYDKVDHSIISNLENKIGISIRVIGLQGRTDYDDLFKGKIRL